MYNLAQAAAIAVIGGADGPTAIYVSSEFPWVILVLSVLFISLFVFFLVRFIKNIRRKNKKKSVVYGIVCLLMLLILTIFMVSRICEFARYKKILGQIDSTESPLFAQDEFVKNDFVQDDSAEIKSHAAEIKKDGKNIEERFLLPDGFVRKDYDEKSFAEFLRKFPLKDFGEPVLLYNGEKKSGRVYASVFDMPILNQDLIQCADAVIKLYAEWLYENKRYSEIAFHITNGLFVPFEKYAEGSRLVAKGDDVEWKDGFKKGYDREIFDSYLRTIYTYAGTISLSKESKPVEISGIEPGDFFISGGSPGHAVLVLDVAENQSGERIMLLGQSYMPSQEFHVLKSFEDINPWYAIEDSVLRTPEWTFQKGCLKRF